MRPSRAPNARVLALAGVLMASTTGLVIYSPTLYRMFCAATGFGGTVQRVSAPQPAQAATDRTVTIHFDANVAPGLPWAFRPEQRKVTVRLGVPTRVNYFARNNSDKTLVARALFNVTPYKAAQYFFKIECFCFTEEKLGPGAAAHMPLELYVDEQLSKDPNTEDVHDITLSYTFFRQKDPSEKDAKAVRDLQAGSDQTRARLEQKKPVDFQNDAPRQ